MRPRCFTTKPQHIFDFPKISKSIFNQKLLYDLLHMPVIFFFHWRENKRLRKLWWSIYFGILDLIRSIPGFRSRSCSSLGLSEYSVAPEGHPTTVFCKTFLGRSRYCLEIFITWERLKISRWQFCSCTIFDADQINSLPTFFWRLIFQISLPRLGYFP